MTKEKPTDRKKSQGPSVENGQAEPPGPMSADRPGDVR